MRSQEKPPPPFQGGIFLHHKRTNWEELQTVSKAHRGRPVVKDLGSHRNGLGLLSPSVQLNNVARSAMHFHTEKCMAKNTSMGRHLA